ncbi:sigma factor-like helix-turn-helix DNA-binding protein [Chitinophaga sp. XS-30]|uniref:sigma factor-like helix-turn-helix DNA-binding protein n=1 Tax=Chitinophaga sp. XS-30 TaxID=2604421 RepID=UPI0011DCB40D|nr:sigma factor-like helix-turn-helix DNA-binding protein [Chitinophaga sp. XS-30]QEH42845.1 hypothetical protein FW415_19000 [Chitinophaga sp. XS-30]
MHLLLNNLSDKELLYRIRKLEDREAAGVLLDRYSHLLVAACLPRLNEEHRAETVFPALTQQLFSRFQFLYGKVNQTVYTLIQHYFTAGSKLHSKPFEPRHAQAVHHLEGRVGHAGTNPIERETLARQLEAALDNLLPEERQLISQFYIEHRSFGELAIFHNTTAEKIRNKLSKAKKKLATQIDQTGL